MEYRERVSATYYKESDGSKRSRQNVDLLIGEQTRMTQTNEGKLPAFVEQRLDRELRNLAILEEEKEQLKRIIADELSLQSTRIHEEMKVTGETSDGYHTFNELYEFRKLYNAALFNEWYSQGKYGVCKSKRHSDGEECFGGGWFIVVAQLPTGQISNHYELKDWDLFRCIAYGQAPAWDGHTEKDVVERLTSLLTPKEEK